MALPGAWCFLSCGGSRLITVRGDPYFLPGASHLQEGSPGEGSKTNCLWHENLNLRTGGGLCHLFQPPFPPRGGEQPHFGDKAESSTSGDAKWSPGDHFRGGGLGPPELCRKAVVIGKTLSQAPEPAPFQGPAARLGTVTGPWVPLQVQVTAATFRDHYSPWNRGREGRGRRGREGRVMASEVIRDGSQTWVCGPQVHTADLPRSSGFFQPLSSL